MPVPQFSTAKRMGALQYCEPVCKGPGVVSRRLSTSTGRNPPRAWLTSDISDTLSHIQIKLNPITPCTLSPHEASHGHGHGHGHGHVIEDLISSDHWGRKRL
eukprot:3395596-Rhodomonas_salina.1